MTDAEARKWLSELFEIYVFTAEDCTRDGFKLLAKK